MAGWLFFLVAFQVALLVVGGLSAAAAVRQVHLDAGTISPGVEGGMVDIPLLVRARRTARLLRFALEVGGQQGEAFLPAVSPGPPHHLSVRLAAPSRGAHPLREVRVISHGLLGMFRAERRVQMRAEVLVRPRFQALADVPLGTAASGGVEASARRRGHELFGVRDYLPGDPARHIHWRSSARHRRLLVKEFEDPAAPLLALVVDTDLGQGQAAFDQAVRAAASIAWTAVRRGWPVMLLWCGAAGPVAWWGNWEQLWDALARLSSDGPPLARALERLRDHLPPEAVPVAVTGMSRPARLPLVLVAPPGATADWEHDGNGVVRCVAS